VSFGNPLRRTRTRLALVTVASEGKRPLAQLLVAADRTLLAPPLTGRLAGRCVRRRRAPSPSQPA
jgi:hypothetical protein